MSRAPSQRWPSSEQAACQTGSKQHWEVHVTGSPIMASPCLHLRVDAVCEHLFGVPRAVASATSVALPDVWPGNAAGRGSVKPHKSAKHQTVSSRSGFARLCSLTRRCTDQQLCTNC